MIAVFFAMACAAVQGTADFCGGRAARCAPAMAVAVLTKAAGLPVLVFALAAFGGRVRAADLAWGALAGTFGMAAIWLFYRALAGGAMTVVAPISAVTTGLVPFIVGLRAERPPAAAVVGAGCAIIAVGFITIGRPWRTASAAAGPITFGLLSGVAFGLALVFFHSTASQAGICPLGAAHLAALGFGIVVLCTARRRPGVSRLSRIWPDPLRHVTVAASSAVLAGVLDLMANVFYLMAAHRGMLSVVAPFASLYPITTVLLALLVDRERVRRPQLAGLVLAASALVLAVH
jgi:uncharacterized membrane protein